MKAVACVLMSFCTIVLSLDRDLTSGRDYLETQEFMELQTAKNRYLKKPFNAAEFKAGTPSVRASMSIDIIERRLFIGKTRDQVRDLLGDFSGFFWSHNVPTYLIEEGWRTNKDTWQVVFLLDEDQTVSSVKIHKNCCPKNP